MRAPRILMLLTVFCLFLPLTGYADDEQEVTDWVQKALLSTLSIDYRQTDAEIAKSHKYYLDNAWKALGSFLGDKKAMVRTQKLELHPFPASPAVVTDTGYVSGIHYWRVNQKIMIPELGTQIDFSVVVLETRPTNGSRFIIQSISMVKKKPPQGAP